jgi:type III secretion system (T3SS) SseB-like protein
VRILDKLLGRHARLSNRKLEALMEALARQITPEGQGRFYRELLRCRLALATPGLSANGILPHTVVRRPLKINFIATTGPDGGPAMLAFTSDAALLAWREVGSDYVITTAKAVCEMAVDNPAISTIFINPRGPRSGGYLKRHEFSALAQGRLPGPAPAACTKINLVPEIQISFASPEYMLDPRIVEALRDAATPHSQVLSLYFLEVGYGEGGTRPVVVVEHAAGANPDDLVPPLLRAAQPFIGTDRCLEVLPIQPGTSHSVAARRVGMVLFERT